MHKVRDEIRERGREEREAIREQETGVTTDAVTTTCGEGVDRATTRQSMSTHTKPLGVTVRDHRRVHTRCLRRWWKLEAGDSAETSGNELCRTEGDGAARHRPGGARPDSRLHRPDGDHDWCYPRVSGSSPACRLRGEWRRSDGQHVHGGRHAMVGVAAQPGEILPAARAVDGRASHVLRDPGVRLQRAH